MENSTLLITLQERLGLAFRNLGFLEDAVGLGKAGKERVNSMAFLGDRLITFCVCERLLHVHKHRVLEIASQHPKLETNRHFAGILKRLGVEEILRNHGSQTYSIKPNVHSIGTSFEAITYALLCDQGLDAVREWLDLVLFPNLPTEPVLDFEAELRHACTASKVCMPCIEEVPTTGKKKGHFTFVVYLGGTLIAKGVGKTFYSARQTAAFNALSYLRYHQKASVEKTITQTE